MALLLNSNAHALVTGAASGIGEACCKMFAAEGVKAVILADRDQAGLHRVEKELQQLAKNPAFETLTIIVDVADETSIMNMFSKTLARFPRIDYAANVAGITSKFAFEDFATAEWDRIQNINLRGVFLCMREELKQMSKQDFLANDYDVSRQDRGVIVNIGSVCSHIALELNASYNASKHGVAALTKTLAVEKANSGIRCNAVGPGFIETPIIKSNPINLSSFAMSSLVAMTASPVQDNRKRLLMLSDFYAVHELHS